jgi:hypothetical protein
MVRPLGAATRGGGEPFGTRASLTAAEPSPAHHRAGRLRSRRRARRAAGSGPMRGRSVGGVPAPNVAEHLGKAAAWLPCGLRGARARQLHLAGAVPRGHSGRSDGRSIVFVFVLAHGRAVYCARQGDRHAPSTPASTLRRARLGRPAPSLQAEPSHGQDSGAAGSGQDEVRGGGDRRRRPRSARRPRRRRRGAAEGGRAGARYRTAVRSRHHPPGRAARPRCRNATPTGSGM